MKDDFVVRMERVSFSYQIPSGEPIRALRDINLEIERGEYVAIVGRNGSGKSTLAKHLNALLVPTQGEVWIAGMNTRHPDRILDIRSQVGMVFQAPDSQIVATVVEEDVAFGPENLGLPREEILRRVNWALEMVGMREHRQKAPHLLSVGQRQRVAIAGALAMRPRILILDEATTMLDPAGREKLLKDLRSLQKAGIAIITITHSMAEASEADRVVVLDQGSVALDAPPRQVFALPQRLKGLGLDVPPMVALANSLKEKGLQLPFLPLTIAEASEAVMAMLASKSAKTPLSHPASRGQVDGPPAIVIKDLTHTYLAGTPLEQEALRGVSMMIGDSEAVGLIGATGSGKSTLLQHLNGLLRPQAGDVLVFGSSLRDLKSDIRALRSQVGLVFQLPEDQLFERYVGDDVAFGPRQMSLSLPEVRERVRMAMEAVGLDFDAFKDRPIFTLSGGEKRRVALAGVLALEPRVLALDEPTSGLDPEAHKELVAHLLSLRRNRGMTLVLATHDMEDVANLTERVYVMANGKVSLEGDKRRVFTQSQQLSRLGLGVPPAAALMEKLRERGFPGRTDALTIGEASEAIAEVLSERA